MCSIIIIIMDLTHVKTIMMAFRLTFSFPSSPTISSQNNL